MEAFGHGIILAFGLIMPLGVQNLFVFNQGAVQPNLIRAFPVIITASLCDTLLILLAVLGVSLVILSFAWLRMLLLGVGFVFLLYMGYLTWNSNPGEQGEEVTSFSAQKQVAFAASVSLLNPHAMLDTIGVIGTSSLNYTGEEKWLFTVACILVSWLWFFGLALAGRTIGSLRTASKLLKWVNRVSALIIWASALYIGYSLLTL